jgi:hypothetical protein
MLVVTQSSRPVFMKLLTIPNKFKNHQLSPSQQALERVLRHSCSK